MTIVTITDDTTRADLAETLRLLCDAAKRVPHVMGVTGPSSWDIQHSRIDAVLDAWSEAPE